MDGVDAAIASFTDTKFTVSKTHFTPYPAKLKARLTKIIHPDWRGNLKTILDIDHEIGKIFTHTASKILTLAPDLQIKAIGTHGQTIRHQPSSRQPNSWQLGDPNLIVEATGITTISDWRRRDIATGGQGAPLTPAFNAQFFRRDHNVVVLNLGGIANISIIPQDKQAAIIGFDTGPANTLLDSWVLLHKEQSFDQNGLWAASGEINQQLLNSMLSDPYFKLPPPKSTGREYFNQSFLTQHLNQVPQPISNEDVQATLSELTARSIVDAIHRYAGKTIEVFICGGGMNNNHLISRLRSLNGTIEWKSTAESGIKPENMEAVAFAWFAKQTFERKPLELITITGGKYSRIAGAIYPGKHY